MEQSITIKYHWTVEDLLQAQRFHFRQACRPVFRFGLNLIFGLMFLAAYGEIASGESIFVGVAFLIAGIYWFAIRPFARYWTARRQFAKCADKDLELEWRVMPEKICIQSSLGQSEFSWQSFTKVVRTPIGVLFYPTELTFYWLPRSGFTNDAEFEKLTGLAKTKIQRCYDVT